MSTFFELGKDKAAKEEGWASPFISCAQDTVSTAPTAIRLWETFTFLLFYCKVKDLFCGAPSGSEPSLFFSNYLFSLGFKPIQDDFQHDFARMTHEANKISL